MPEADARHPLQAGMPAAPLYGRRTAGIQTAYTKCNENGN